MHEQDYNNVTSYATQVSTRESYKTEMSLVASGPGGHLLLTTNGKVY